MRLGNEAAQRGDLDATEREFAEAERLIGDNPEMRYWHAIALLGLGKIDDGLAILREVGRRDRNWIELTLRLPAVMLQRDVSLIERPRAETAGVTVAIGDKSVLPRPSAGVSLSWIGEAGVPRCPKPMLRAVLSSPPHASSTSCSSTTG